MQNDLKKMVKGNDSDDEDSGKKAKKAKRTGPSLLQLERARYASTAAAGKQKKADDSDVLDVLAGFRSKLAEATSVPAEDKHEPTAAELALGIEQDGDSSGVSLHVLSPSVSLGRPRASAILTPSLGFAGRGLDEPHPQVPQRRHSRPALY